MTEHQFLEFVAKLPVDKQLGACRKLARLLEAARAIQHEHGLNLDPVTQICFTGGA